MSVDKSLRTLAENTSVVPRAKYREDGFPTRSCLQSMTPAERSITDAMAEVEKAGASLALTDAVVLLGKARDRVADHVEGNDDPAVDPKDVHIQELESENNRLKSGLDDIEQIVFADRLRQGLSGERCNHGEFKSRCPICRR